MKPSALFFSLYLGLFTTAAWAALHQGKGWGSAAIRQGLTRAGSEGLPVYLETAKESNVGLYRKLGFKLVGEWDVPTGGPHFWSMLYEN
jgi:hypothetical protein